MPPSDVARWWYGLSPDQSDARDGTHVGDDAMKFVNVVPLAASASMCGVGSGVVVPPLQSSCDAYVEELVLEKWRWYAPIVQRLCWSVRTKSTCGSVDACGGGGGGGGAGQSARVAAVQRPSRQAHGRKGDGGGGGGDGGGGSA